MKFFVILISFFSAFSFGQNILVKGILYNNEDIPMSYATINFEKDEDVNFFRETMTDESGAFEAQLLEGEFTMVVQPIQGGLISKKLKLDADTDLGIIKVDIEVIALGDVTAMGERPIYRLELDKRVYDMDRDPTVKGANLSDALNNVPSVEVDEEGTVSLRGNESVKVLINGKPSSMTGISNVGEALKNMQADGVERVEVITNPSARYDAEGSGGIINIILKKNSNKGFNANFNANVGLPTQLGLSSNINYKIKDWNFFASPYIRFAEPEGSSKFINRFYSNFQPDTIETQSGKRIRKRTNYGISLGFDRYIGEKSTLSISANTRKSNGKSNNTLHYFDYAGSNLYAESKRIEEEDETDFSMEGNIGFKHEFNKNGHEFNVQLSASYAQEDEDATVNEQIIMGVKTPNKDKSVIHEQQKRYLIQADYVYPHGESGRFEFGYKNTSKFNLNDFAVERLINNQWTTNPGFTDKVNYDENINALYTQYGNRIGKFSYLLGLRMEYTAIRIQSKNADEGNGSDNKKSYPGWFPSVTINYTLDEADENQIQLSYSKRLRRPWSRFLNPFFSFSDDRNTFRGNPDLDPTFTNAFELSYITQLGKAMITPSVYYQSSKDIINVFRSRTNYNGNNIFISQPINAGKQQRYGAELIVSSPITRWWRVFGNFNLYGYNTKAEYFDDLTNRKYDLSGEGISWNGRISNNFSLPNQLSFRVNGNYRAGQKDAQSERKPSYSIDLALSKDVLKGAGTISLSVRDLLNSRKFKKHTFGVGYDSDMEMQWRSRQISLNFSYRINQNKKRERESQRGSSGEDMEAF